MSNNTNSWKRVGGFSRTGTQNYVRNNDATMGGTIFGSTDISQNTGNNVMRIGNNSGVIFMNGDIDMTGGPGIATPINRIKNVRDPYDNQDVATKFYVDKKVLAIQQLDLSMGPTGPEGPPGVGYGGQAGSDGPTGATGPTGLTGPPGDFTRVFGPTGPGGAKGATGADGAIGATGPKGSIGERGIQGIQGIQGSQGSNGTIIWLNPDGDSISDQQITDSYKLSSVPISSGMRTIGPITVSATYGNANKTIPANRFWNTALKISTLAVIPSGVWVVNLYANCAANSDANQLAIYAAIFMITGTTSQPSPDSLIIETEDGGDSGYYPPRSAYLPSHIKYIGKSWSSPVNILDASGGALLTSTTRKLYKLEIPVEFTTLKDASGSSQNVYVQLQLYIKNLGTQAANQSANAYLYYQTDFNSNITTYSYVQTTLGAVGNDGAQGTAGTVGATGPNGINGSVGPTGSTGTGGPTGYTGPAGATGPYGPTGPTGPSGKANSQGPQYAVQYRSDVPSQNDISGGDFSGNTNIRYVPSGSTTNASSSTTGTLIVNDVALNSIHSSFYVEDPSITAAIRPRTFIRGGEASGSYVIMGSGIDDRISVTKTPASITDITQGIKLIHNISNPASATINLHNTSNTNSMIGLRFKLASGNITAAGERVCINYENGSVGVGGITDTELTDINYSGLNRRLHVTGNVMVGTHPGVSPTFPATNAAMFMMNQPGPEPSSRLYPGLYHRNVNDSTVSSVLGGTTNSITNPSDGLSIISPNFITFQTGTMTPQSNSIVINSAGDVSIIGRANLNGRVSVNKGFAPVNSHDNIAPNMDISGILHISSEASGFTDNPRIKLISKIVTPSNDIPSFGSTQSVNEIRGVVPEANTGFLRLSAQNPSKSCIDLVGENISEPGSKFSNSIRIATGAIDRMVINGVGNVGIGTTTPGVRLDVVGAASVAAAKITSTTTAGTALVTSGRVGINVTAPTVALDVAGAASITGTLNMNSNRINNLLDPSSTQDAATKSYVDTSIPVGGIIMWSGTTGTSLPSNWKLCDGSTYNSIKTPDLRGRFVLSSGQGSGGLTNRTVDASGGVETVALTEAQMPKHKHDVGATTSGNDGDHSHTISDPGHFHTFAGGNNQNYAQGNPVSMSDNHSNTPNTSTETTGISINNYPHPYPTHGQGTQHKHTITVTETEKGSSNAHENMPPFYVLAFIMRIS